jgi:hypothetical protein
VKSVTPSGVPARRHMDAISARQAAVSRGEGTRAEEAVAARVVVAESSDIVVQLTRHMGRLERRLFSMQGPAAVTESMVVLLPTFLERALSASTLQEGMYQPEGSPPAASRAGGLLG